jgi:hypothetical protein
MYVEIHIKGINVTAQLLNEIKAVFSGKTDELHITVDGQDETDYLLSTEANRKFLAESVREAKAGKVVRYSLKDLVKKQTA